MNEPLEDGTPESPTSPRGGFGWSHQPLWLWLVLPLLGAALSAAYRVLAALTEGYPPGVVYEVASEATAAYGAAVLIYLWLPVYRLLPAHGPRAGRHLMAHLPLVGAFSALHTSLNWFSRSLLFPVLGLGAYDYGKMPLRYLMELPADVIGYIVTLILCSLLDRYRAAHRRELALTRLEARFAEARLGQLRGQLRPHFLFNTLNTVSSVMYDDVERADRVLADLGELLRRSLDQEDASEVSLDDELSTLELYADIMRARLGDRLQLRVDVDEECRRVPVPTLLLQPLVENAIRHGEPDDPNDPVRVEVSARKDGDSLLLEVSDRGPGLAGPAATAITNGGIGLRNSVERIDSLYGEGGALTMAARAGGGVTVRVRVPWR